MARTPPGSGLAARKLEDADLAIAAGFGDLSHFNRRFKRRYRMTPTDLRSQAHSGATPDEDLARD
jgi:AraC-like DNA-binding protein